MEHGYNRTVARSANAVFPVAFLFAGWLAGCAAAVGPGYVVREQEIRVDFSLAPQPAIHIAAQFRLQNTGNQPLDSLDVRLPGRRFHPDQLQLSWDAAPAAANVSPDNPRDTELRFPQLWKIGETHTLKVAYEILSQPGGDDSFGFGPDAFYLPEEGWTPQLPQSRGLFGFGGVPPKEWPFVVTVPEGFLVHSSGGKEKRAQKGAAVEYRYAQTADDLNPFVIAGKYFESRQTLSRDQAVRIWTRSKLDPAQLRESSEALSRVIALYDSVFGARSQSSAPLWIVECPATSGCISQRASGYSDLLYGQERSRSAAMISRDSVVVDPQLGVGSLEAFAGPALAASWLGYGQNPGFYEQQPPVSALPAFAAALAQEASSGPAVREEVIRRALAAVPDPAPPASNSEPAVTRAKSLLLFYALRDRVGVEAFRNGLQHMLYARRRRGFDVSDLIAALEQEARHPVGPFVRQWIKRPGVPAEFRNRYSQTVATQNFFSEEKTR